MIYLNEFDPFAAEWLSRLSFNGELPLSFVDSRSIADVTPDYIDGFDQCHFFAGIGGWPLAFALAGIPSYLNAWSGSCPCQPFSTAGEGKGQADSRHLWPIWFPLIRECQPEYVFGEQVAAAIGHGWLDGVFADMEGSGYTGGAVVLGAHSVGAPHIRQRIWWGFKRVSDCPASRHAGAGQGAATYGNGADSLSQRGYAQLESAGSAGGIHHTGHGPADQQESGTKSGDDRDRLLNSDSHRCESRLTSTSIAGHRHSADAASRGLQHAESDGRDSRRAESGRRCIASGCGGILLPGVTRLQGHAGHVGDGHQPGWLDAATGRPAAASGAWSDYTIGQFRDGKSRRIGRGVQPLAYGIPRELGRGIPAVRRISRSASGNRKGRLKGYGNAIVPILAALFIRAFMEVTSNDE